MTTTNRRRFFGLLAGGAGAAAGATAADAMVAPGPVLTTAPSVGDVYAFLGAGLPLTVPQLAVLCECSEVVIEHRLATLSAAGLASPGIPQHGNPTRWYRRV